MLDKMSDSSKQDYWSN